MTDTSTEITNPKFRMWLRPDGIVQLVWEPHVEIGLEDAIASTGALTGLVGGRRHPLLVDVHAAGPVDRRARMEWVRRSDLVAGVAVIVTTSLGRMSGNIFLALSKPTPPTRLFADEASAVAWLIDFAP